MESAMIKAEERNYKGKGYLRQIRMEGYIPAVLYGKESGNHSLKINAKDLRYLVQHGGKNSLIDLVVENETNNDHFNVMIKDMSWEPVKGEITHVDFQQVSLESKIHTRVSLLLTGTSEGVAKGGTLQFETREIEIECLPTEIPEAIKVDVTSLEIGDSLYVRDISTLPNVNIVTDNDTMIATILSPRLEKEVTTVELKDEANTPVEKVYTVDTDEA